MKESIQKTEQPARTIQASGRNQKVGFVDNRHKPIIQKMNAYDESEPLTDPRHFSTSDIKAAIDKCVENETIIPGWLKDMVDGYLRDELNERDQDMQRYGGGDSGHRYYFELVRDYVDKVDSLLAPEKDFVPTSGPALQL